ncbi:MAG: phosphotransferase [archaeon]|nr:MAG: phosphotransferase [archaeon]
MILTKLNKSDFEKILDWYSIGRYRSHKHIPYALSNTIYLLRTSKGKFILKVFECNIKHVRYQIRIIESLKKLVPVAQDIETRDKKIIFPYKKKYLVIQKFAEGKHPKTFSMTLIKDCADKFALMNKRLSKLRFRSKDYWGPYHQFKKKKTVEKFRDFKLQKNFDEIVEKIRTLDRKKIRRSIIHADLTVSNILVKGNKLTAILDFDDAHTDFLVHDIATFMGKVLVGKNKVLEKKMKVFLKTFQNRIKLNSEEKKACYYFMMYRILKSVRYAVGSLKKNPDRKKFINRWFDKRSKVFNILKKYPIEKFLKLF